MNSNSFMNAVKKQLDKEYNVSYTENGAKGYATTCHKLLDMNFKVSSYRNRSEAEIEADFNEALNENFKLAIAWMFYVRDVRGGLGERRAFRVMIKELARSYPKTVQNLIPIISEYGRWDDVVDLMFSNVHSSVVDAIKRQLSDDIDNYENNKPISLLAKWLPSINTSSAKTREKAKRLCKDLHVSDRFYRKTLAQLRAYTNVVEAKISRNMWSEVNYEAVPSKANLLYKDAFMKHDEDRRTEYLESLSKGEVKINSSTVFPHEIIAKYQDRINYWYQSLKDYDETLEQMWKALPNFDIDNTIVVADGSGSMTTKINGTHVSALDVANGLAIYCAQKCRGEFKNTYITFSNRPQIVKLNHKALRGNIEIALKHNEVATTNIEKVFNLILETAINSHMNQDDIPKNILILSDMEFNSATSGNPTKTLFGNIAAKYASYGYKLPRLVFWNICGRTDTIPVKQNELGVALVSGFSVNIIKMVMSDILDPYQLLVNTITSERYQKVFDAISK